MDFGTKWPIPSLSGNKYFQYDIQCSRMREELSNLLYGANVTDCSPWHSQNKRKNCWFSPESLLPTAQPDWTRRCPLTQLFSAQHRTWGHFHTVPGGQCPLQQGRWPLAFAQAQRLAAAGRGHWSDTRQDTYSFECVLNDKTRNIKELLCFI